MFKRTLVFGLMALAALPAYAANIATRTGSAAANLAIGPGQSTSMAVNFTLAAGTSYNTISFAPLLNTTNGSAATGSAYISNGIGTGATLVGGPIAISVPASQTTATATTITFPGVTLAGGSTYYLVISNGSGNLGWGANSGAGTETLGTGVTAIGADVQDLGAQTGTPYASPTFSTAVTSGGSSHVLLFAATGTVVGGGGSGSGGTSVPTLGEFGMIAAGSLLALCGVLFLRRQPANPLR